MPLPQVKDKPGFWPTYGPTVIAGAAGLIGTALAVREARKNREFQERMSSTSHQREVSDLKSAGLNPALSAGHGASTPGGSMADIGDMPSRAVATALAVRQARANISLTEAQAASANAGAQLSNVQAGDIVNTARAGRMSEITSRAELSKLSVTQQRQLLPIAIDRAKAELRHTQASAKNMEAITELNKLLRQGRVNMAEFEKKVGTAGPATRYLVELVRLINNASVLPTYGQPLKP